jgi:hypothetical protein
MRKNFKRKTFKITLIAYFQPTLDFIPEFLLSGHLKAIKINYL